MRRDRFIIFALSGPRAIGRCCRGAGARRVSTRTRHVRRRGCRGASPEREAYGASAPRMGRRTRRVTLSVHAHLPPLQASARVDYSLAPFAFPSLTALPFPAGPGNVRPFRPFDTQVLVMARKNWSTRRPRPRSALHLTASMFHLPTAAARRRRRFPAASRSSPSPQQCQRRPSATASRSPSHGKRGVIAACPSPRAAATRPTHRCLPAQCPSARRGLPVAVFGVFSRRSSCRRGPRRPPAGTLAPSNQVRRLSPRPV